MPDPDKGSVECATMSRGFDGVDVELKDDVNMYHDNEAKRLSEKMISLFATDRLHHAENNGKTTNEENGKTNDEVIETPGRQSNDAETIVDRILLLNNEDFDTDDINNSSNINENNSCNYDNDNDNNINNSSADKMSDYEFKTTEIEAKHDDNNIDHCDNRNNGIVHNNKKTDVYGSDDVNKSKAVVIVVEEEMTKSKINKETHEGNNDINNSDINDNVNKTIMLCKDNLEDDINDHDKNHDKKEEIELATEVNNCDGIQEDKNDDKNVYDGTEVTSSIVILSAETAPKSSNSHGHDGVNSNNGQNINEESSNHLTNHQINSNPESNTNESNNTNNKDNRSNHQQHQDLDSMTECNANENSINNDEDTSPAHHRRHDMSSIPESNEKESNSNNSEDKVNNHHRDEHVDCNSAESNTNESNNNNNEDNMNDNQQHERCNPEIITNERINDYSEDHRQPELINCTNESKTDDRSNKDIEDGDSSENQTAKETSMEADPSNQETIDTINTSADAVAETIEARASSARDNNKAIIDEYGCVEFEVDETIKEIITCPLCEGMYREPITTVKCRHTFCKSCFTAAYELCDKYDCPVCSQYLGQDINKTVLADRTLETLIDKVLFPTAAAADAHAEREFYKQRNILPKPEYASIVAIMDESYTKSANIPKENLAYGSSNNKKRKSSGYGLDKDGDNDHYASESSSSTDDDEIDDDSTTDTDDYDDDGRGEPSRAPKRQASSAGEVRFRLMPHIRGKDDEDVGNSSKANNYAYILPPLDMEYISTQGRIRIGQLKQYLCHQLAAVPQPQNKIDESQLEIYCHGIPLGNELSVTFILSTVWMNDLGDLTLTYGLHNNDFHKYPRSQNHIHCPKQQKRRR